MNSAITRRAYYNNCIT